MSEIPAKIKTWPVVLPSQFPNLTVSELQALISEWSHAYSNLEAKIIERTINQTAEINNWSNRARKALKHLRLDRQEAAKWLDIKLAEERRALAREESLKREELRTERLKLEKANRSESARIKEEQRRQHNQLAKDKDLKEIHVFKHVAREVLGDEMYMHLWHLVNIRLGKVKV